MIKTDFLSIIFLLLFQYPYNFTTQEQVKIIHNRNSLHTNNLQTNSLSFHTIYIHIYIQSF